MIKNLIDWFERTVAPAASVRERTDEHALQLATAVMLVEVMRADASFQASERAAVQQALVDKFGLDADEAAHLGELAEAAAREATDLFTFTSLINDRFEMPQKLRMIEHLWRVAYADGTLGDHERHVLWRIADLLHIPQGAYVQAKARARDAGAAGTAGPAATPG